jgi:hypothetical protein
MCVLRKQRFFARLMGMQCVGSHRHFSHLQDCNIRGYFHQPGAVGLAPPCALPPGKVCSLVVVRFLGRSFRHWSVGYRPRMWTSSLLRVKIHQQLCRLGPPLCVSRTILFFSIPLTRDFDPLILPPLDPWTLKTWCSIPLLAHNTC